MIVWSPNALRCFPSLSLTLTEKLISVLFADLELVGIPHRITVGPKGLADGKVEYKRRRDGAGEDLPTEKAAETVAEYVLEERR